MSHHPAPRPRHIQLVFWLILAAALMNGACRDRDPVAPNHREPLPQSPAVISDPITPVAEPTAPKAVAGIPVVYVSLLTGTFPGGIAVTVRNRQTGNTVTAVMIAGGLDPVEVEASVGDTLEFTVTVIGRSAIRFVHTVPARKPPVIVRTDPPPAKRDVPLNAKIVVVFSEPMDPTTVSTSSIKLSQAGTEVSGQVTLGPDGLSATFQPDALLQDEMTYSLAVTTAVTDLDGDLLPTPFTLVFQTDTLPEVPLDIVTGILAFTDPTGGISLMTADGAYYTNLTSGVGAFDIQAAWSPDGSRIAFSRYAGGRSWEIHLINADGTNLVRVSPAGGHDENPTWSSDGSQIAFIHRRDTLIGGDDVYVMTADGTNRVRLTYYFQPSMGPAWSPDGSRIAFMTYSDSGTADIHLINADGTNRVGVTNDSQFDWQPAWSPDGSRIAFVRDADVFTMNADGTNLVRLTTHRLAAFPSWSPDGLYIAYTLMSECDWPERCAGATLWTIRLADGHQSPLPTVQENALFPSWRP
jgi:hypothetical protein